MMAATLPFAPSVVVSPGALPTHRELRRIIAALEQKVYTLQIEVAQHEASANFVTNAICGALPASELEHALHAILNTERGRRLLGTALRPARDNVEFNKAAEVARRILGI